MSGKGVKVAQFLTTVEKVGGNESSTTDHHALETFQRIIKRQCDALLELGFDPSVKVRCIVVLHCVILSVKRCKCYTIYTYFPHLLINPRRACAGGLRYLSCVSVCLSVCLFVCLSVCYHSSGDLVRFNARSKVRGGFL